MQSNVDYFEDQFYDDDQISRDNERQLCEVAENVEEFYTDVSILNCGQRSAYERIVGRNKEVTENVYFIDGPAGTGKTFLLTCIFRKCQLVDFKPIMCVAYTGIAATLLPNGLTIHAAFGVPLNSNATQNVIRRQMRRKWRGELVERISKAEFMIFDECSMIPRSIIDAIDGELRNLTKKRNTPFGGKQVVFSGDFRQLLAISSGGQLARPETIRASTFWPSVVRLYLTDNVRARADSDYAAFLLTIGNGAVGTTEDGWVVPQDMRHTDLVKFVYYDDDGTSLTCDGGNNIILTGTNAEADHFNAKVLNRLAGKERLFDADDICLSVDAVEFERLLVHAPAAEAALACTTSFDALERVSISDNEKRAFFDSLKGTDLPPRTIALREKCLIVLTKNVNVENRLCNGTRLVVRQYSDNKSIICTRLTSSMDVDNVQTSWPVVVNPVRTAYILNERDKRRLPTTIDGHDRNRLLVVVRTQLPVRVAFAMTITKSQGQTFDKVGIYLPRFNSIFTHGHLYTALSRSSKRNFVKIYSGKNKVRNICELSHLTD